MTKKTFALIAMIMTVLTMTAFAAKDKSKDKEEDPNVFKYVSAEYNYSIDCPKRPHVVSAALFLEDSKYKGELLVFENVEYEVKRAWLVLMDAFNTNAVPDFNNDSKEILDKYLTELQKQGYEGTTLVDITKDNKGVLGITATEIEIDEDGDGQPDATLVTDHQEAITFFRMPDGRCVSVQLIGTDGLNEAAMSNFRKALTTFSDAKSVEQNSDSDDKKSKKDKKNKKK